MPTNLILPTHPAEGKISLQFKQGQLLSLLKQIESCQSFATSWLFSTIKILHYFKIPNIPARYPGAAAYGPYPDPRYRRQEDETSLPATDTLSSLNDPNSLDK